jgi:nitrogen regulatory protein PII
MKQIIAYIKPHKLSEVTLALHKVEDLTGLSVSDMRGFGRTRAKDTPDRIVNELVDYVPHIKLEIVCHDGMVAEISSIIQTTAHTGLRGDGKIYVVPVETACRISTGETGEEAV